MTTTDCSTFSVALAELATDGLDEPERSRLLAHAAGCPQCQTQLDELSALADRLLVLTPEHEPPAGFEDRVLARFDVVAGHAPAPSTAIAPARVRRLRRSPQPTVGETARRRPFGAPVLAAAAVVIAVVGLGVGRWIGQDPTPSPARTGVILAADSGTRLGLVELLKSPTPHVLVTIEHPHQGGSVVRCQLELADGRTFIVGSWGYDEVASGVWAVGIDAELLHSVRMRVVDDQGRTLAVAPLT